LGVWFRVLKRIDRALVDAVLTVISDKVRSPGLIRAMFSVVKTLQNALKDPVSEALNQVGFPLAHRLGIIAQKWGNPSAYGWGKDLSFARFLAVVYANNSGGIWL
jgi:hypothetical protein